MAKQVINVGTAANDKKGDSLRAAFQKVNTNFTELYTALGINADVNLNLGAFEFTGSTMSTTDSSAIVIDQATTITSNLSVGGDIVPQTALGGDLGSSTLPWRSLYVSNNTIFLGGVPLTLDANNNLTVNGSRVGTTSYADLSDKPTSFSSLVNGAQTVSLSSSPVSGTTFSSGLTIHRLSGSMANITSDINKVLQIATQTSNGRQEWSFGTDGSLTLPQDGGIKSDTDIDITIDTPDSSTFNWQFGADGILTLPSVGKISNGAYDWTFGSTGITTFPGVINAGNINNLVVNDLGGGTSLTAGSQVQIGNSAGIAGAGVLIKNAVTNTLGGEISLESGSKIQMDNGIVSLSGYTYTGTGGGDGLEFQMVVEVENNYPNNVVRIGARIINTIEGSTTNVFQGVTISQYGNITFPDNTVQSTAWTGFSVAADDSTQRLINAGEVVKFVGAGGITTASDAEGNITINYVQGDIRSEGNINIEVNLSDSTLRRWQFGEDGYLTLPNDRGINSSTNIKIELPNSIPSGITNLTSNGGWNQGSYTNLATTGGTGTGLTVNAASQASNGYLDTIAINTAGSGYTNGDVITITNENFLTATFTVTVPAANTWTFGENGRTTFPNGAVPVHSYGVAGDKEGMVAFDDTYIYYCTADYVNNISDIWKRVAWSGSTW